MTASIVKKVVKEYWTTHYRDTGSVVCVPTQDTSGIPPELEVLEECGTYIITGSNRTEIMKFIGDIPQLLQRFLPESKVWLGVGETHEYVMLRICLVEQVGKVNPDNFTSCHETDQLEDISNKLIAKSEKLRAEHSN